MNIDVRGRHLDVSEPLRAYAQRRVQFAIGSFEPRIRGVGICITDVNGPRGGVDKACVITVLVNHGRSLFARARGANAYSTVDRTACRIRTILLRRLRMNTEVRRPGRPKRFGRFDVGRDHWSPHSDRVSTV
jgi:putative sigma-54 modulation protein